jgi:hypothetical protein
VAVGAIHGFPERLHRKRVYAEHDSAKLLVDDHGGLVVDGA